MADVNELRYKTYCLNPDPMVHEAAWGARLIYADIKDGYGGVVWDRQDVYGDRTRVEEELFPLFDRFIRIMRWAMNNSRCESNSRDCWYLRQGLSVVAGSPQASYGYLYVTAVAEYVPGQGRTMFSVEEKGRLIDVTEMADDALKRIDESIIWYRANKYTGINVLKKSKKELEAALR
jgi:hypothetical protein